MPRRPVQVQVSGSHWSRGHMAAYIRPRCKSEKRSTESVPHHKQLKNFSLHSVRLKTITNSRNWRKIPNPNRFRSSSSSRINGVCCSSQRFNGESSSLSLVLCNSSIRFVTKATNPNAITEARIWEEEGTNSKILNQRRRKRRRITVYFRISSKNQQKQNQIKKFLKIQIKSPDKSRWNSRTYLFILMNNNKIQTDANP